MTKKQHFFIFVGIIVCGLATAQVATIDKTINYDVSIGYAPSALFTDNTIGNVFTPVGTQLGFTAYFLHKGFNKMGAEVKLNWAKAQTIPVEKKLETNAIPICINFAHKYRFNNRLSLDSHAGIGMSIYNLRLEPKELTEGLVELGFTLNIGTALQIAIDKGFYAEAGAGYIVSFPKSLIIQQIVPTFAFGYQF